jgi:hypothetical protein
MFSIKLTKLAVATFVSSVLVASAGSAFAETRWEQNHPRRDQVNDRLENQSRRINQEYREGEISRNQARMLHREDRFIRNEERYFAARDGGHITRGEQAYLNRQESFVSRQIGR